MSRHRIIALPLLAVLLSLPLAPLAGAQDTDDVVVRVGLHAAEKNLNPFIGELHRWMQVIGHDGRSHHKHPIRWRFTVWHNVSALRNERASRLWPQWASASRRLPALGRDPSTVWREIDRSSTPGGYDAEVAQAAADARARRPKTPVLAADPELAAAVTDGLRARRSPHALSAEPAC